ncbi:hypothetical protein ACSSS7_000324 [Eimeria intestinalis]
MARVYSPNEVVRRLRMHQPPCFGSIDDDIKEYSLFVTEHAERMNRVRDRILAQQHKKFRLAYINWNALLLKPNTLQLLAAFLNPEEGLKVDDTDGVAILLQENLKLEESAERLLLENIQYVLNLLSTEANWELPTISHLDNLIGTQAKLLLRPNTQTLIMVMRKTHQPSSICQAAHALLMREKGFIGAAFEIPGMGWLAIAGAHLKGWDSKPFHTAMTQLTRHSNKDTTTSNSSSSNSNSNSNNSSCKITSSSNSCCGSCKSSSSNSSSSTSSQQQEDYQHRTLHLYVALLSLPPAGLDSFSLGVVFGGDWNEHFHTQALNQLYTNVLEDPTRYPAFQKEGIHAQETEQQLRQELQHQQQQVYSEPPNLKMTELLLEALTEPVDIIESDYQPLLWSVDRMGRSVEFEGSSETLPAALRQHGFNIVSACYNAGITYKWTRGCPYPTGRPETV